MICLTGAGKKGKYQAQREITLRKICALVLITLDIGEGVS